MMGSRALFYALLLCLLSCSRKPVPAPGSTELKQETPKAPDTSSRGEDLKSEHSGISKIVPVKRVPIVGGCSLKCTSSEAGVRNFLVALLHSRDGTFSKAHDATQNPMLFLDSHGLRVNAQHIASSWHVLWTEGRFKDRTNKVHQWLLDFREPLSDVLQNTDVDTLIEEGVRVDPERAYAFEFMAPGLNTPWKIQLKKRGVEWLITSIDHTP